MEKHAYLVMAHKNFEQLIKLIRMLEDERNDIYIHLDSDVDINYLKSNLKFTCSKIIFIDRINVNWGGYSQIKCELSLLKSAVCSATKYSRYHLISGLDLPIKKQDYIHDFFYNNCMQYIRFDPKPISLYEDRVKYYYPFQDVIGRNEGKYIALLELMQNILVRIQKILKVNRCKNLKLYKGVNWFSITDNMARHVLSRESYIKENFKLTFCADELFLQTVVMSSPYKNNIVNSSLRYIDWERGSSYTFQVDDYKELMNNRNLFARKFDDKIDAVIIDMLLNEINSK